MPDYPIETERLVLRPFLRGDVDAVHAYRRRPDVARFLFDGPMDRRTCEEAVAIRVNQTSFEADGDRIVLAIERRAGRNLIGEVSLIWRGGDALQGEIGYIVNPDFQRRGYASEAVAALIRFGLQTYHLHRIYARCDPRNVPSFHLMERLGMRREAHLQGHILVKGEWANEYIYAILADEWARSHCAGENEGSLARAAQSSY